MKFFILSVSALAVFVGLSSCEKHDWKETQKLFDSNAKSGQDDHGHAEHSEEKHDDRAGHESH